jgi:hypothetical protein
VTASPNTSGRETCWPNDVTGARATGIAMTHNPATATSNAHFHGTVNAIRACSAFNSGYHPAAQRMWKTAKSDAQIAAPYAAQGEPRPYIGILSTDPPSVK